MTTAPQRSNAQVPVWRQVWRRLSGRLRHGLLTQEILDRLARLGLVFYPYFLVLESIPDKLEPTPDTRCTVRMLGLADVEEMVRTGGSRYTVRSLIALLSQAACLGIFYDGKLAGHTWAGLNAVPVPGSQGQSSFELQSDEAYLFDMHVVPRYRGLRLAGVLRQAMQRELTRRGRTRFYSITLAFNRSSRRFKARLGARELELRIYLRLSVGSLPGCDLRLWHREPHLKSAWLRRVPAAVKAKSLV